MKIKFLALLAVTAVTMAGCSLDQINFLPAAKIRAQISVLEFTGTYTAATTTTFIQTPLPSQTVTFQAASGSMGGFVTGFEVRYEDQNGASVAGVTSTSQTLNQSVAAGRTCNPTATTGNSCTYQLGSLSGSSFVSFLTQQVATSLVQAGIPSGVAPTWRAKIIFSGVDTNGNAFQWQEIRTIRCNCTFN